MEIKMNNYEEYEKDFLLIEFRTQELVNEGIQPSLARLIAESEVRNGLINLNDYINKLNGNK